MPHYRNFRFHQTAVQTLRSRFIETGLGKYKIIPGLIAIDVHMKDVNKFVGDGLGEEVTGRVANGAAAYQSLKP